MFSSFLCFWSTFFLNHFTNHFLTAAHFKLSIFFFKLSIMLQKEHLCLFLSGNTCWRYISFSSEAWDGEIWPQQELNDFLLLGKRLFFFKLAAVRWKTSVLAGWTHPTHCSSQPVMISFRSNTHYGSYQLLLFAKICLQLSFYLKSWIKICEITSAGHMSSHFSAGTMTISLSGIQIQLQTQTLVNNLDIQSKGFVLLRS